MLDFDDTHLRTVIHPTAPVAPGLFALAERRPITGAALLHAFVLGVEVECRVGNALSPGHYRRGWHITATCGVLGAAAAAGKLLRLDSGRMAWALGVDRLDDLGERVAKLLDLTLPGTFAERWRKLGTLLDVVKAAPRHVSAAPCQET